MKGLKGAVAAVRPGDHWGVDVDLAGGGQCVFGEDELRLFERPLKAALGTNREQEIMRLAFKGEREERAGLDDQDHDAVNHPAHYTAYAGLEVIDLTEQLNFNRGNAVKYVARAGLKSAATEVEDLRKAVWYIGREIARLEKAEAGR
ncbi:DUF3310 domain-containing protein [Kitasatospora sp. NPDC056184]|uniref:DUF3310 domain-containing protein n=1 Tax=Kitasatospora sp. NPDC056184 TaxID=3345738 RepID=UPI0035DCAC62